MNLRKLRGLVTADSRVVLDLSDGVFEAVHLDIDPTTQLSVRHQIDLFFKKELKSTDFEVARITYEEKLTPPGLVPEHFYLATGGFTSSDNSGYGTLYIFFKTKSSSASDSNHVLRRELNDPLSIEDQIIPKGYEVALFISNRIVYDIVKEDIKNHFRFGVHTEVLSGKSTRKSQYSKYVVGNSDARRDLRINLDFERYKSLSFTYRLPGNTLRARSINKGRKIQVHWTNDMKVSIPFPGKRCGFLDCHDVVDHVTVNFNTKYVKNFTPVIDKDLTITYKEELIAGKASSCVSSATSWWHGSNFKAAKKKITSTVNDYMSGLSLNFRNISAFAITQVVFPNKNVFHLTEVYVPGDMLILGTVNDEPSKG